MIAYVDSSILLRLALAQPRRLSEWPEITQAVSSALAEVECFRTLDRLHLSRRLTLDARARAADHIRELVEQLFLVPLADPILRRAAQPFGAPLGTLDALHLATALAWRDSEQAELVFATHDAELGAGASILGFQVFGV